MIKSTFTTLLFLAALVALSTVAHAQSPNTSSVPTVTSATEATRATSPPAGTITPPPRTGGNFTAIPDFGSLATLIASLATGKSANSQATGTSNSAVGGSTALMSTDSRAVMAGLALVMLTTVVATMGTLTL
ncbi:hypothetical protein BGZ68_009823 [Mortierella alpina]|nr:hypothetical protein BGZ68_009823 [Mortierella alpina]